MIIDTHMHLYDSRYKGILDDVINECLENNVTKMIVVGCDYETSVKAIELANKYPFIYASVGLHPSDVKKEKDLSLSWIYKLANNPKVVAIGEIGLDYYWDKSNKELQKEMFIKQIEIANKLNLPVIVHSRDSAFDTYNTLKNNLCKGVLHCYSSSLEQAKQLTKLGYYLGIGGVVTFKNSKELKRVVEGIDINYLLTETDSPYLAPNPYRGQINKPSYIPYIIEEISNIKNENKETIENIMYNNAIKLFNLK